MLRLVSIQQLKHNLPITINNWYEGAAENKLQVLLCVLCLVKYWTSLLLLEGSHKFFTSTFQSFLKCSALLYKCASEFKRHMFEDVTLT